MKTVKVGIGIAIIAFSIAGCGRQVAQGPPDIRLDDSMCEECNMIISDERFATATIYEGPRGAEAMLFDDFNCQAIYEASHSDMPITARWSHDYESSEWLTTEAAHFLFSPRLTTPMASQVAAFSERDAAARSLSELGGEVLAFEDVWARLNGQ